MSSPFPQTREPSPSPVPQEKARPPASSQDPTLGFGEQRSAPAPASPALRTFGNYELLQEVGRGGMGVVYKARQTTLNRLVALKMILPGPLAETEDLHRFRIEAEATARLQHPGIVTVHEVGQVEGQHFYSMDFIEGPSLSQRLLRGPLPGRQAARYVMLLAQAVQHAHRHGIIHRDIKPSNVLMDADDQPHLTDFGLAKRLGGEDSSQTRTGAIMGTPSYMAPEQAEGRIRELGPACDIYSLGAVLYELLTGRPPFRSDSPIDTLKHVLELEPAPPRLLNPKIDHDLETICLKCLQKDPQRRYATAEALADDLNRYLSGETITARSFNVLDRLARTLDRSQHDIEFRSWGNLLLYFAAIVFVGHILMFVVIYRDLPRPLHWLTRLGQFALMGVLFWRFRARRLLPASNAERELWTIWLGYLTAYAFTVGASILMSRRGEPWDELTLYPFAAVLTGLAFFVMGSSYWGRCYTIGLAFFALAVLMSLSLTWAPLEFGSLWGLSLLGLGWHVRKLGTGGSG